MAEEVVAPAVRVLDYGYQAPNPVDYQRAALAGAEPMQRAMSEAMAARNQFALSRLNNAQAMQREMAVATLNNQRAMELAKWQHDAQIQREKMRDDRMLEVADKRAKAQLDAMKEKGMLDDLKNKSNYLTSRLGGNPVARMAGESDEAYGERIDGAIKDKLKENITADTSAAYNAKKQIAAYNQYVNDPKVNQAVQGEMAAATNDPNVQAQARNYVNSNLSNWLQSVAGDKASAVAGELQQNPSQAPQILQKYGLAQQYNDFVSSARQTAAYGYLKATGSSATKQFATANENLKILGQQLQNLSTMPGDNGRMVPKPWWSQVQNSVSDMELHDAQVEQKTNPALRTTPTNPLLPPPVAKTAPQNPVTPKGVNPADFDANGASLNTAPLAVRPGNTFPAGFSTAWDFYGQGPGDAASRAMFGPRTPASAFSDLDRAKLEAAYPGFWNGMLHAPGYLARQVGSLFDSRVNPNNAFTPDSPVSIAAAPYTPRHPVVNPAAPTVAPAVPVPIVSPQTPAATNVVQIPQLPTLQVMPSSAQLSPFTGMPAAPASTMEYQDPYSQYSQMLQMRSMYGQ